MAWFIWLIIALVIVAVGYGIYWFFENKFVPQLPAGLQKFALLVGAAIVLIILIYLFIQYLVPQLLRLSGLH
jgi:hypothetical protein